MTATAPHPTPRRRRDRHPQWWLWPVAAAGWAVLGALSVAGGGGQGGARGARRSGGEIGSAAQLGAHAAATVAMVAVMTPLIAVNVRYAARRSPRGARGAVARDVVAGWALVWVGAAVGLGVAAWVLTAAVGDLAAVALATVVAVGWQYTGPKRRSLARCHGVLAPPLDRRRSRRACHRYGLRLGRDCVVSCWPLMGLMVVTAHAPLVAVVALGTAWFERRRRPHHDPGTGRTAVVLAATGAAAFVTAAVGRLS